MNDEIIETPPPIPNRFPVAAIGASAGGLEAVTQLLYSLPDKTGIAYVYIQHLDPAYESNLAAILQRETKMPVVEAVDKIKIEPDHVYVMPPNKEMSLVDGIIAVSDRPSKPYSNMPINRFFMSLAERYKEYAIGIVLSGTASDGTLGLKAIKMEGGVTIAQDSSAKFQSMPKSAAAEGGVDLVLSPKQIADELVKLGQHKDYYYSIINEDVQAAKEERTEDADFVNILQLVQRSVGVDFTQYKMTTIKRRILRRMMIYKSASVKEYLQYIKQHTKEIDLLYQDLLINVTAFFRDTDSAQYLQRTILPKIIKAKAPNDPIRVWVAACSTGQEAYSLAMLIVEELGDESANTPIQIFATDLSENVINKARLGLYTQDEISEIPPKRLQRFFTKVDGHCRIIKTIRDLCIFATHNIAKDPPFSRLDLISCCNLLIYLDTNLQRKLMATFHYSLNNEGFLILGKSETIGASTSLFSQVDKKYKIYSRRKDTIGKPPFDLGYRIPEVERPISKQQSLSIKNKADDIDLEKVVDNILLKKYSPASVIVTGELDIVQFRGSTGLFLEAAPGRASLNLMKMARQGMAFELRNIVHKAKKTGESAKKSGLSIKTEDKTLKVSIEALPLKSETDEEYFLVIFEQEPELPPDIDYGSVNDERVKQLEAELASLREDMRSIVESQEAANEELQSANEEIVSSNEELQSINEELETSKEEIESSNEELTTINQELQVRNEDLAEAHEYSQAVYDTITEAVLILDKELRIKTGNKAFFQTFKTTEYETVGMLFNEIGDNQWNLSPLKKLLEEVALMDTHFENYEVTGLFPGIGQRTMVLTAKKVYHKIHGSELVLLAIEDITEFRKAQKVLQEREAWFKNMANNAPVAIWISGLDKLLNFMNDTGLKFRGITLEEAMGREWTDGAHPDDHERIEKIYHQSFDKKQPFELKYRLQKHDGKYYPMLSMGKPNYDTDGAFTGFVGTCTELPPLTS